MAGEVANGGGGAPAPANQQPAGVPARAKVGQMSSMLRYADAGNQAPPSAAGVQALLNEPAPLARVAGETETGPDLGHPGDLDGFGDEQIDDGGVDAQGQSLDWDDSAPSELVDPDEYVQLKTKWDADDLAPELFEKFLPVPVQNADGSTTTLRKPVSEVITGFIRASDYSAKLAEVSEVRRQAIAGQQGQLRLMQDLSQPQTFLQAMHTLGKFEVFEAAAELYAKHERWPLEQLKQTNPAAYQLAMSRREAQKQLLIERQQRQQLEQMVRASQQQQAPQQDPMQQQVAHQLSQMLPIAAKRVGLADSPFAQQIFAGHWADLLPSLRGPLTTEFVVMVMQATKETVEKYAGQGVVQPQQNPRLPPNSGQTLPGRAASAANGNGVMPRRAKIGDMSRMLRGR